MLQPRSRKIPVEVNLLGSTFLFELYGRRLMLGPDVGVDYYWMDSSRFRRLNKDGMPAPNLVACIAHWRTAMQQEGVVDEDEQLRLFILATCYPLVASNKGMQNAYRDAFLRRTKGLGSDESVSDEIRDRINAAVAARDRMGIMRELDRALEFVEISAAESRLLGIALEWWLQRGMLLVREAGAAGLKEFSHDVGCWLQKYRKRCPTLVRTFIDLFAYESKVAFYTCYANAWIDIIPRLREEQGLDLVSERFLRFWHNQNQPVEVLPGQTPHGIYYPTSGGAGLVHTREAGSEQLGNAIRWRSEQIGPTHLPDVFRGQVLGLHPLSAVLMKDSGLRAVVGHFFQSDDFDLVMRPGARYQSPAYWDLIGAILHAAYIYRQALDRQNQNRRKPTPVTKNASTGPDIQQHTGPTREQDKLSLLDDYAAEQGIRCFRCNNSDLECAGFAPTGSRADGIAADFRCRSCRQSTTVTIGWDAFSE